MKTFLVLLAVLYTTSATLPKEVIDEEWAKFKGSQKKRFINPLEESFRKEIFEKNLEVIDDHNARFNKGLETYEMGVNRFSDRTEDEILMATGLNITLEAPETLETISANNSSRARIILPISFDWRNRGKVTPVKDQKSCGSCWAFAANGALEAHYKIRRGVTAIISEQQLVDCVLLSNGCKGGNVPNSYNYIRTWGIQYSNDYPYKAKDGRCRYNLFKPKIKIRGYGSIARNSEAALKKAVATQGPVAVAITVENSFHNYKRGVYYNPTCNPKRLNHAVVVVGYGRENAQDYWLVKNSWGTAWGENGYIKMARNRGNNCGIAAYGYYPLL